MSSLNVIGFFALAQGKRIATLLPGATFPIHHNHYVTCLKSTSDDITMYPSATLRVYSGSGDAPLPDNTIAFVIAKACAPTGKPIELDALYLSAFPGDPNDDQYDVRAPIYLIRYFHHSIRSGTHPRVPCLHSRCRPCACQSYSPSLERWH
ncbi:hypothetical protein B0H13DRAFT_1632469 [Mycena leptocephala]|nr:hypothetical protein B0H13DRAFT_1632469 [Mycena leptocephala]